MDAALPPIRTLGLAKFVNTVKRLIIKRLIVPSGDNGSAGVPCNFYHYLLAAWVLLALSGCQALAPVGFPKPDVDRSFNGLAADSHLLPPTFNEPVDLPAAGLQPQTAVTDGAHSTLGFSDKTSLNQLDDTLAATIDVRELPLSELLAALAEESGIDIAAADLLEQPVTLRLNNQSLSDTLDVIATRLDAGWRFQNGVIHVFSDRSVTQIYPINYLNIARHTQSSVGLATRVGSFTLATDTQAGATSQANNSETRIDNESTHDFWSSLLQDLEVIGSASSDDDFNILINREAGLVTVIGHHAVQRSVREYLRMLQQSVSRQVLIEATVVEVSLTDEHRTGVDWRIFNRSSDTTGNATGNNIQSNGFSGSQSLHGQQVPVDASSPQATPSALFSLRHQSATLGNLTATLELLRTYGSVHILSQPQIIALNNQSAVLKVVDNRVYFSVEVERSSSDDNERITTESRIHTVPVGLVMSVIPFISADGQVVLNIRPSISRILGFRDDPIPALATGGIRNSVPEIQVREMESVLSVKHGETIVIGGLMQQNDSLRDTGVSGLRSLPWVGKLFGREVQTSGKSELLVFLRPTVINQPI